MGTLPFLMDLILGSQFPFIFFMECKLFSFRLAFHHRFSLLLTPSVIHRPIRTHRDLGFTFTKPHFAQGL